MASNRTGRTGNAVPLLVAVGILALLAAACTTAESSFDAEATSTLVHTPTARVSPTATRGPATATPIPSPSPTPAPPPPTLTPAPPSNPAPPPAAIAADLLQLQANMASAIENYGVSGIYSVAVTDLQTGETVSVNGARPMLSGCVMNFFVLLQVTLDVQQGRYPVQQVDSLIAATTWSSNAVTARDLYQIAGNGNVTEGVRRVSSLIHDRLGLDGIIIDHPPAYLGNSLGIDYNNWLTAEAMNRGLATLWNGDLLDAEHRTYLLSHLNAVKPGLNYLTAAVPEGIVNHKNGFFHGTTGFVDNDAGIVRLIRGGREYAYAISFFSQEVPIKYGDIGLGQTLSSLAYEVMSARYP